MCDAVQIQSMFRGNIIRPVNHGAPRFHSRRPGKNSVKHGFILMDRLGLPIIIYWIGNMLTVSSSIFT
jgi:hypothetical protein